MKLNYFFVVAFVILNVHNILSMSVVHQESIGLNEALTLINTLKPLQKHNYCKYNDKNLILSHTKEKKVRTGKDKNRKVFIKADAGSRVNGGKDDAIVVDSIIIRENAQPIKTVYGLAAHLEHNQLYAKKGVFPFLGKRYALVNRSEDKKFCILQEYPTGPWFNNYLKTKIENSGKKEEIFSIQEINNVPTLRTKLLGGVSLTGVAACFAYYFRNKWK